MRKFLFLVSLGGLLLPATVQADKPRAGAARAVLSACRQPTAVKAGSMVVAGRMRSTDGRDKLMMRFAVERLDGDAWQDVTPAGFDRWRERSGYRVFKSTQTVRNLEAGYTYRALVQFQWERGGSITAEDEKTTTTCRQRLAVTPPSLPGRE